MAKKKKPAPAGSTSPARRKKKRKAQRGKEQVDRMNKAKQRLASTPVVEEPSPTAAQSLTELARKAWLMMR